MTIPLKPFILDCDTGRDDALAIWCAIALGLPLAGAVASYGNVVMTSVLDNTARVLSLAGWDNIPLFAGASRPSRHHAAYENVVAPRQKKSGNGLCNIHLPRSMRGLPDYAGADGLAEQVAAISRKKGPLDYIISGPATNFSGLCDAMGSRTGDIVSRVTMVAGKFELWDRIPGADFNMVADPYAVRFILEQGIKIRLVPMDTTWPVSLNQPDIQSLVPTNALARTAQDIMVAHCRYFAPEPVFRFHDPAALMAMLMPEGFVDARVDIILNETSGEFGRIIETEDGFPVQIYRSDEKTQQEFLNRILSALGLSRGAAAAVA